MDRDTSLLLLRSRDLIADRFAGVVTLEDAAREAGFSPFHYHRLFVERFGQTPHEFLTERRLERARLLLATTDLPVTEICLEAGYASLGTFSSRFRRIYGKTPTEYRLGTQRFWHVAGFRTHRFIPMCFVTARR